MKPSIETLTAKKMIGIYLKMSFTNNRTFEIWRSFMPRRKEIQNSVGNELYSIEVYDSSFWQNFNPNAEFEKWASVEVSETKNIPAGMEVITLPEGLYAVFVHKGPANAAPKTYEYIFRTWLPASEFLLDNRPHFAVMGEKYKNDDPDSEEEIWIPIKPKK